MSVIVFITFQLLLIKSEATSYSSSSPHHSATEVLNIYELNLYFLTQSDQTLPFLITNNLKYLIYCPGI